MKLYNISCPICGTVNYNLDLEESNGSMECEFCKFVVKVPRKELKIPKQACAVQCQGKAASSGKKGLDNR